MMKDNVLHIQGVSVEQLATACQTPLYIYDENKITEKLSRCLLYTSLHDSNT